MRQSNPVKAQPPHFVPLSQCDPACNRALVPFLLTGMRLLIGWSDEQENSESFNELGKYINNIVFSYPWFFVMQNAGCIFISSGW